MKVKVKAQGPHGYRTPGRYWPPTDTIAEVTPAELAQLKESPRLLVVELSDPQPCPHCGKRPDEPLAPKDELKAGGKR